MLLKPRELEGKITLTPKQRAAKRAFLFDKQYAICACGCGQTMAWEQGRMNTATLDHITPQPAGCAKRDNDDNLRVIRWDCNAKKGSKRL